MDLTLAVNEKVSLPVEGYGWYLIAGDGPVEVELREHDGSVDQSAILQPGQGIRGSGRFEGFTVKNRHSAAQAINVYIGKREFIDNRNVGIVQVAGVVETSATNKTADGGQYMGSVYVPGVAAQYPAAQIENPAASGVTLVLRTAEIMPVGVAGPGWVYMSVAYAQLTSVSANQWIDKCIGRVPAPQAVLREQSTLAVISPNVSYRRYSGDGDRVPVMVDRDAPIEVPQGYRLTVGVSDAAADMAAHFEWEEVPI